MPSTSKTLVKKPVSSKSSALTFDERVRKRYFDELKAMHCLSSDDDNYPEGPPPSITKKQRRHLTSLQVSLSSEFRVIQSTLSQFNGNADRLATAADAKQKDKVEDEASHVGGEPKKSTEAKRVLNDPAVDLVSRVTGSKNVYEVTEESYKNMLARHRNNRRNGDRLLTQLDCTDLRLEDIGERVRCLSTVKRPLAAKFPEIPAKERAVCLTLISSYNNRSLYSI